MKEIITNITEFIYTLSMGDYFFFMGTFMLFILFVYIFYLIKLSDIEEKEKEEEKSPDAFDLSKVSAQIEEEYKPEAIVMTSYEEEQEKSAIISYEELVQNKDKFGLLYDDEYDLPELNVKKITLTDKPKLKEETNLEVKLMQYDKEEAFLKALKELQENLSH